MQNPSPRRDFHIRPATAADVPLIHALIRELAEFEKLADEAVVTEAQLQAQLFGPRPAAEVLLGEEIPSGEAAGFALYFQNFSTFLGRPGLYLEDLFVRPPYRRRGLGQAFLQALARIAVARGCGRFEWTVLDWNAEAIRFYEQLGARRMEEWTLCRVTGAALEALAAPAELPA